MELSTDATLAGVRPKADNRRGARPRSAPANDAVTELSTPRETEDDGVVRRFRSSASITVTYKKDARLGIWCPTRCSRPTRGRR